MNVNDLFRNYIKDAVGYTPGGKPLPPAPEGTPFSKLNANENMLGPSPKVVEAMKESLTNMHLYPGKETAKTRDAIAAYHGVTASKINLGAGSTALICALHDMFLNPGDEVVAADPTYVAYRILASRQGADVVKIPTKDFACDPKAMLEAITEKTKLVCIVNPNNPTGAKITNEELHYYFDNVPDHVITIVDEAYIDWIDDNGETESAIQYVDTHKVVVLRTFSKLFALAGLRFGYSIASEEIAERLTIFEYNYSPNRLVLKAVRVALEDTDYIARSVANNTQGRNYIYDALCQYDFEVVKSYTSFIYFKPDRDPEQLLMDLNQKGVLIRPFGEYLRVSIGRPEQNEQFVNALKEIMA